MLLQIFANSTKWEVENRKIWSWYRGERASERVPKSDHLKDRDSDTQHRLMAEARRIAVRAAMGTKLQQTLLFISDREKIRQFVLQNQTNLKVRSRIWLAARCGRPRFHTHKGKRP